MNKMERGASTKEQWLEAGLPALPLGAAGFLCTSCKHGLGQPRVRSDVSLGEGEAVPVL